MSDVLARWNFLPLAAAVNEILPCCGSRAWAHANGGSEGRCQMKQLCWPRRTTSGAVWRSRIGWRHFAAILELANRKRIANRKSGSAGRRRLSPQHGRARAA